MSRKNVYKLPVVVNSVILESKYIEHEEEERKKKKEEEIDNITKEAYERGRDEALEKNREKVELISQSMEKTIEDLKQERDDFWSNCEDEIIRLAFAVAKKALYEEISQGNSKILEGVVSDAINRVKDKEILRVFVNPVDVENLEAIKSSKSSSSSASYEIVKDDKISRGGCRVVTDCGGVDAMVETRWNEIVSAFGEHSIETEGV